MLKQLVQDSDFASTPAFQLLIELVRYGFVGLLAFSIDFLVLVILTEELGICYLVSAACGFSLGVLVNYLLCISWVFSSRTVNKQGMEFFIFALVGVVGLFLTEAILWFGTSGLALDYRISKLVAVAVVLFWNFGSRKYLLFRSGSKAPKRPVEVREYETANSYYRWRWSCRADRSL
jgi:putative flippase GtrA